MKQKLQTPLARARGLGSAKDGTNHWIWQRITAIALIPTSLVFVFAVVFLVSSDNERAVAVWLSSPLFATTMVLMLIALFYHAKLGVQVIIEDYVHQAGKKTLLLIVNQLLMITLGVMSVLAVLKLHFGFKLFI